jgi:anti-sigma factor RsiW
MRHDELARDMIDVIDGVATPEQTLRLQRALSSDPDASELFRQMRELDGLLRSTAAEPAPADLKATILESLETLHRKRRAEEGWFATIKSAFARRPALGYACTFSFGLGAGVLLLLLVSRDGPLASLDRQDRVSATMTPQGGGEERSTVSLKEGHVTVTTRPSGAAGEIRLQVDGRGPVDVTVRGVSPIDSIIRVEVESAGEVRQEELKWNR